MREYKNMIITLLCTPPVTMRWGPEVTNVDNPLVKRMKWFVQTNVASMNTAELHNLSLEVKGEFWTSYGDKDDMEGNDECKDNEGNVCEEAPNDLDIRIRLLLGLDSSTLSRSSRLYSTPTTVLKADE